jgi:hypothetical protein
MPREITLKAACERQRIRLAGNGSWWDIAPRPHELGDLAGYHAAVTLWRRLARGGYTMISCRRGRTLYRLAGAAPPGALVDCGTWNGGSTALLAAGAPGRRAWAFDSFEGLPEPGSIDSAESIGWGGELRADPERVRSAVARATGGCARLEVRKGWFEDTLPAAAPEIGPIAVLHVDGDWHDSVMTALESLYGQVVAGGYVVIDDYGHWPGARAATDAFRQDRRIAAPLTRVDYSGAYWRTPA